jgi:uncharacterized protein
VGSNPRIKENRKSNSKGVEQGDRDSQLCLGYALHEGKGIRKNYKRAVHCYKLGAKAGDTDAQRNLSLCYRDGHEVSKFTRWQKH